MSEDKPCRGIRKGGRTICSVHKVELVTQAHAREMGLTKDEPSLNALVCPESGAMFSSVEEVDEIHDDLERG
jgi:hypothetical protein